VTISLPNRLAHEKLPPELGGVAVPHKPVVEKANEFRLRDPLSQSHLIENNDCTD
jgi:hypothetical protein